MAEGKKIDKFKGDYRWLSNFQPVWIEFRGREYPSVEHAYMSAKSDNEEWKQFCFDESNTAGQVKRKSRNIELIMSIRRTIKDKKEPKVIFREEDHSYWIEGKKGISVSNLLGRFHDKLDEGYWQTYGAY